MRWLPTVSGLFLVLCELGVGCDSNTVAGGACPAGTWWSSAPPDHDSPGLAQGPKTAGSCQSLIQETTIGERNDLVSFNTTELPQLWGEPAVGGRPCGLRTGDLDGDHFVDAVTVDSLHPVWATAYLFPQARAGSFPANAIKDVNITDLSSNDNDPTNRPWFTDFVTADFDGDGTLDLALAHGALGQMWILVNLGDGSFRNHENWQHTFPGRISGLATADVNGDKHLDLVAANPETRQLMVWLGDGKGNFALRTPTALAGIPFGVALSDVNQDGYLDTILTSQEEGRVSWLLGDGRGNFGGEVGRTVCAQPRSLQVADLDRDGKPDWVMACAQAGGIEIVLAAATAESQSQMIAIPNQPTAIALDDLDGDKFIDIIVGVETGQDIYAIRNQPARPGTFAAPVALKAAAVAQFSSPFALTTADVNRDGRPDIIVAHHHVGGLSILLSHVAH